MAKEGGQKNLQARCLAAMPDGTKKTTAKEVATALLLIKAGTFFKFVVEEVQSQINIAIEFVNSISADRMPTLRAAEGNKFLTEVKDKLRFFVHFEIPGGSTHLPKLETGTAALTMLFKTQEHKFDAQEKVPLQDLHLFDALHWLLTPAQANKHQDMIQGIYTSAHYLVATPKAANRRAEVSVDSAAKKAD